MPLPPLADNLTVRAWLKYFEGGDNHELCFRLPAGTSSATVISTATTIANGLKGVLFNTEYFASLRWSEANSDLSFPLAFTTIMGTNGGANETDDTAKFVALSGRSSGGYRCRVTFFTGYPADSIGFRTATGTTGGPSALYSTITALSPALVAKDGNPVIWNSYVNVGYNAYWQRQKR